MDRERSGGLSKTTTSVRPPAGSWRSRGKVLLRTAAPAPRSPQKRRAAGGRSESGFAVGRFLRGAGVFAGTLRRRAPEKRRFPARCRWWGVEEVKESEATGRKASRSRGERLRFFQLPQTREEGALLPRRVRGCAAAVLKGGGSS